MGAFSHEIQTWTSLLGGVQVFVCFVSKKAKYFADPSKNINLLSQVIEPPVFRGRLNLFLF